MPCGLRNFRGTARNNSLRIKGRFTNGIHEVGGSIPPGSTIAATTAACSTTAATRAAFQRTVRIYRYARRMFSRAVKSLFLAALAMALGLMLGAVTKFGFGYDLTADASPAKIVAKNYLRRPAARRSSRR